MKLTYIQNIRMPTEKAHGVQVMKMCESFAQALDNVKLVVPRRLNRVKENPFDYYGIPEIFKIKKLPCLDFIFLDKYLGHVSLWIASVTFAFFSFWYLLFEKADIIYTRDKFLIFLSFFKKNLVFEVHTLPRKYFLYAIFLKRLKGIVVITRKLKELFVERGISPDKILVAPDGVDLAQFDIKETQQECRQKLGLPPEKKIVLYTGHLYEWKGAQTLADASQYLPADAEVYFVGGTEEDRKEFEIRNLKLEINVVGHRPHSEIPYWLRAVDVLILPNSGKEKISKYWTSPMKMFEYMASKRPIVASDLPSIGEILNKENAVLVESDNPKALSQGIKEVLQNFQLSDRISARAFEDIKEYTWQKRAEKICQKIF